MSEPDTSRRPADEEESFHTGRVLVLTAVAALGGFLFGFDTSVINGGVDAIQETFGMGSALTGFTVSSALLGCMVGAYLGGRLADRWGRTRVMVLASLLFSISALGSGFAFGPWDLILWRLVGGLGVGAASVIAPAYIAEVAPPSIRGRLGSLQQLAIVSGIFVALLSDAWLAGAAGGAIEELWMGAAAWRWMFWAELIPAVAYGVLALMIPESPRYLVANGLVDEARKVLRSIQDRGVDHRIDEIRRTVRQDEKKSVRDLFRPGGKNLLPIVWIGIALSVFQQLVGINVIFYYSTTLWQAVGFSENDSFIASVINGLINVLSTIVAILIVDKVGRKPMLLGGSIGMFVTLLIMAIAFSAINLRSQDIRLG